MTAYDDTPNGAAVATFIERLRTLTPEQAQKLHAAYGAAWDAVGDAPSGAAWYAAWDAAWRAAGDAAWDAAWRAAGDAARDAAKTILVRDRITPEQYAILVKPFVDAGLGEWV